MKRHKAPGLSWQVAEMAQAAGNIGTYWNSVDIGFM